MPRQQLSGIVGNPGLHKILKDSVKIERPKCVITAAESIVFVPGVKEPFSVLEIFGTL